MAIGHHRKTVLKTAGKSPDKTQDNTAPGRTIAMEKTMKEFAFGFQFYARRLFGLALLLTLLLAAVNTYAANLTASVDRDTLGLDETFTLVLRYDRQINATPDYELLRKDFDILNTQSGTQMSIINGNMEASTEWKIALAPKRIGQLLIPSFNIDGAVSDAIQITVEGKSRSPQNGDSQVTVELETNKDTAYVQEQIIVTLRLYTTVGLSGIDLQPLQVKDALVVQLDEKQYQTKINGRPGAVVETRYALFPQQSGELLIPSVLYQVSLDAGQQDLWDRFYGNSQSNIRRLRTDEQRLTIKSAPTANNNQAWLPANKVELVEHWSASVDSLKVGEPITRTITIKADGLTAGQIAPLQLSNPEGLTFYNDQAQTDDQKTTAGILGSRIETIAIVPTKTGRFTLPETKVNWWDTNNQRFQEATLPAVTLNVSSGAMSSTMDDAADAQVDDTTEPAAVPVNTDLSTLSTNAGAKTESAPTWLYLTNLLTLLTSLFFGWQWLRAKKMGHAVQDTHQHEKLSIESEAAAWGNLKRALGDNNLPQLRKSIIEWSRIYWQDKTLSSLQGVAARAQNPELDTHLQHLDSAIFSNQNTGLETDPLLQLLVNIRRRKYKKTAAGEQLQPLYKA